MGVLVALVAEGSVLVPEERRLFDKVGHGALVAFGADLDSGVARRHGQVRPYALLPAGVSAPVRGTEHPRPKRTPYDGRDTL